MLNIFEAPMGFVTDPRQMTAVPQAQLEAIQAANAWAMRQAAHDPSVATLLKLVNALTHERPPEKPLDERFAAFKARLAAAIEKRRATYPSQT